MIFLSSKTGFPHMDAGGGTLVGGRFETFGASERLHRFHLLAELSCHAADLGGLVAGFCRQKAPEI